MSEKINNLKSTVINFVTDIKEHWSEPAQGKNVSYKELLAYSFGGVGVQFVLGVVGHFGLWISNIVLSVAIGLSMEQIQTMIVISTIIGFIVTPIRGMMFDNTKSKKGKFRPYLITMGTPSFALALALAFMPYDSMTSTQKFLTVLVLYNIMNLFSPFFGTAYSSLPQVMSSNTDERTFIYSISTFIYSLAPTITGGLIPLIGKPEKLETYRVVIPIFGTIGVFLSLLAYFGTKERIIVSKNYVPRVKFWYALKELAKNRFFWIIYGSGWLGFLTVSFGSVFGWVYYMGFDPDGTKGPIISLITLILGTAAVPGMLLSPILIKKFGKKNLAIATFIIQIVGSLLMILFIDNYVLFFVMHYIKNFGGAFGMIYTPAMKADALDYQQYKTGKRFDGMFEQIGGLLGSIIAMGTGYIMPFILKANGLTNNYDDLYQEAFRNKIVFIILICTTIGTAMSMLPYFFYNLSEKKHKNIINILRIRAMFEDYSNNELSDESLIETMNGIKNAENVLKRTQFNFNKKEAKKLKDETESAQMTINELNKFKSDEMLEKIEKAKAIYEAGPISMAEPSENELTDAVNMPENTKQEKALRRKAIKQAEDHKFKFEKTEKEFISARNLVKESEMFDKYDELLEKYHALANC